MKGGNAGSENMPPPRLNGHGEFVSARFYSPVWGFSGPENPVFCARFFCPICPVIWNFLSKLPEIGRNPVFCARFAKIFGALRAPNPVFCARFEKKNPKFSGPCPF